MRTIDEIGAELRAISDIADRSLSEDEMTRYETLERELATANRERELRSRDAAYRTPVAGAPVATARDNQDEAEELRAFNAYLRTGQPNADLVESRAQSEGTNTAGGYLVPSTMLARIVERQKAFGGLAPFATQMPTGRGEHTTYPSLDDTANSGVIAAENTAPASGGADVVFGQVSLDAYTYMATGASNAPIRVSVELQQDADFDVQSMLVRLLGTRLARAQAPDWATGSGSSKPDGICRSGLTADVTQTPTATFTYANLIAMENAIDPAYLQNARWVMNSKTWGEYRKLVDTAGRPLVIENAQSGIAGPAQKSLLGYPVVIDQAFPDAATATNFAVFGDIEEAYVIRRIGSIAIWVNPYASSRYVEYEAWERADGTVQNRNAFAILKGGAS